MQSLRRQGRIGQTGIQHCLDPFAVRMHQLLERHLARFCINIVCKHSGKKLLVQTVLVTFEGL